MRPLLLTLVALLAACGPPLERLWLEDDHHFVHGAATTPEGGLRVALLWELGEQGKILLASDAPGEWNELTRTDLACTFFDQQGGYYRVAGPGLVGAVERFQGEAWTNVSGDVPLRIAQSGLGCAEAWRLPTGDTVVGPDFDASTGAHALLVLSAGGVSRIPLEFYKPGAAFALFVDGTGTLWSLHGADAGFPTYDTVVQRWDGEAWIAEAPLRNGGDHFLSAADGNLHIATIEDAWSLRDGEWIRWDSTVPPNAVSHCAVGPSGERVCVVQSLGSLGRATVYRERAGRWDASEFPIAIFPFGRPLLATQEALFVVTTFREPRMQGSANFAVVERLPW